MFDFQYWSNILLKFTLLSLRLFVWDWGFIICKQSIRWQHLSQMKNGSFIRGGPTRNSSLSRSSFKTQSISAAHNVGPSVNPAHACFFRIKIFIFTELKVETGAAGKSDRRQNGRRGESCHPEVGKPQPRSAQRLGQPEKGKKNHLSFWF